MPAILIVPIDSLFLLALAAALGALITFFSGFGLGTLLVVVFSLWFPMPVAVVASAAVHFSNNLFKLGLLGRNIKRQVFWRFGIPALLAAVAGAWLLSQLAEMPVLYYSPAPWSKKGVTLPALLIGLTLVSFGIISLATHQKTNRIGLKWMPVGGLLSGFFGGLTGTQGPLRAIFLINAGLSKEQYVATSVALAMLVDLGRIPVYLHRIPLADYGALTGAIAGGALASFAGAWVARRLLHRVSLHFVQRLVATFIMTTGVVLVLGVV